MQTKRNLIIQASNQCPCYCPGCYNFPAERRLSTPRLLQFIRAYQAEFGIKKVTISGGDPLFREDLVTILDFLIQSNLSVSLDTVGSTLLNQAHNKALMHALKRIACLGLPLDGLTTSTIQLFRHGINYEESIDAIQFAALQHIPLCINTVVHLGNICEIFPMVSVIEPIQQIFKWQLFQYMPIGPGGSSHRASFAISQSQFDALSDQLHQVSVRSSLQIQPKSLRCRKNQYLLLGYDGILWIPRQTSTSEWDVQQDENERRIIIGSVTEKDIIRRIKDVVKI